MWNAHNCLLLSSIAPSFPTIMTTQYRFILYSASGNHAPLCFNAVSTYWSKEDALRTFTTECGLSSGSHQFTRDTGENSLDLSTLTRCSATLDEVFEMMVTDPTLGYLVGEGIDGSFRILKIYVSLALGRTCTRFNCVCGAPKDPVSGLPKCTAYTY